MVMQESVDSIASIEGALENCAQCNKAFLPTLVFNAVYRPLLKDSSITESEMDMKFAEIIEQREQYICKDCPNMLYNRKE